MWTPLGMLDRKRLPSLALIGTASFLLLAAASCEHRKLDDAGTAGGGSCPTDCGVQGLVCDTATLTCVAPTSGGAGSGSGGDTSTAGTGGQDTSGGTGGTSGAPGTQTIYEMIDDLEDGDGRILTTSGRQGPWHIFNNLDGGGNQQPPNSAGFTPEMGGANGSMFAAHTSGDGYSFAGIGFDLNNSQSTPESPQSQAFDASSWDGIVFRAKAGTSGSARLRVELPMRSFVPTERGGSCGADCWNVYGYRLASQLTTEWQEYKVTFAQMDREMGGTSPAFDKSQIMSISFKHEAQNNDRFDFWIDDVRFYKDPPSGGGAGGMSGAGGGGSAPASCSFGTPQNGTGSFTWYYFGQGSFQEDGGYRTACGYFGREPSGQDSDVVENIAVPGNFAAISSASSSNFDSAIYCGACAEISNAGRTAIVTIVDACPRDLPVNEPCRTNQNGHLDISRPAFNALGYGSGNPMGTTWRFVPCPVMGNVKVRIKPGNNDQVYVENTIFPIKSVSANGQNGTRLSYGAWSIPGGDVNGKMLTITDIKDRSITVTVSGSAGQNQDSGQQFPACSGP